MGMSLLLTGEVAAGRAHFDRALALYDPTEHRPLATRFGQDVGVAILSFRSLALWLLGYLDAALADSHEALGLAREMGPWPRSSDRRAGLDRIGCCFKCTASARNAS